MSITEPQANPQEPGIRSTSQVIIANVGVENEEDRVNVGEKTSETYG